MLSIKLVARLLLLVGGLGHVVPGILAPILLIGVGPVTIQMIVGVLSVVVALYLIVKKVP